MMPSYTNGNVPAELLIKFNAGYDDLGYWEHLWPAHTLALHNALVALAAKRRAAAGLAPYPLTLQTGWCAYRPLHWQQVYRSLLGIGAATPGTSSHGGTFEGSQTMAGDYAWQSVYRDCGGRAAFFEDCRAVGLLPGMIMADRGYPDEDWHVIDPAPWAPIPAWLNAVEFTNTPLIREDQEMYVCEWNGHILSFGRETVKHETSYAQAEWVRNITAADDKYIGLNDVGIIAVCETFGIPWYAVDAVLKGKAFDYTNGTMTGHFWSRELENGAKLDTLLGRTSAPFDPSVFSQTITETISKAIDAKPIAADIDPADIRNIAQASADERDRRDRERLGS